MKKKLLLLLATVLTTLGLHAQWTAPKPTQFLSEMSVTQIGAQDTTYYYLYLQDKGFLNAGWRWGTMACVADGGLKVFAEPYAEDGAEWDGKTVKLVDYFTPENGWRDVFMFSYGGCTTCMNGDSTRTDVYWEMEKNGSAYRFKSSMLNAEYPSTETEAFYLGLDRTADEGNMIVSGRINSNDETLTNYDIDWLVVSADYYEGTILPELERYQAAVALKAEIDRMKAAYPDIDLGAVEAIYNNTNSTKEELEFALNNMRGLVMTSLLKEASQDNPINVSEKAFSLLGIAWNFDDRNIAGWHKDVTAGNHQAANSNGAVDPAATGIHYENWDAQPFSGSIWAEAEGLPKGLYKVEALTMATIQPGEDNKGGVFFFANDQRVEVTAARLELGKEQNLMVNLTETGNIKYGLDIPELTGNNWVGMDNVIIWYYGETTADPEKLSLDDAVRNAEAMFPDVDVLHANSTVKDNYKEALASAKSATADYATYNKALSDAIIALNASINDYKKLKEEIDYAKNMQARVQAIYPELAGQIDDLLMDWEDQYNSIMSWTATEIGQLHQQVTSMVTAYISENIKVGDDISVLLENNRFDTNDFSGWMYDIVPGWGGLDPNTLGTMAGMTFNSGVAEYYRRGVNLRQALPVLPAGVYRISVQGFDDVTDANTTVLYAQAPGKERQSMALPNINDYGTADMLFSDGTWWDDAPNEAGKYIPHGLPGTNAHFNHDEDGDGVNDYTVAFNVVLTEQTDSMVVGVWSPARRNWVAFDNFGIVYLGEDLSAYKDIVNDLKAQIEALKAQAKQKSGMGADAMQKLATTVAQADAATTAEQYKTAIAAIKDAIAYAQESITLYDEFVNLFTELAGKYETATTAEAMAAAEEYIAIAAIYVDELNLTNDEVRAEIKKVSSLLTQLKLPANYKEATESNPVDMTVVIENADIEQGATVAWIAEMPKGGNGPVLASGINGQSMEYWTGTAADGAFNYYQSLGMGLPSGVYRLSAKVANSYSDLLEMHEDHETTSGEIGLYVSVDGKVSKTLVPTQTALCTADYKTPSVTFMASEGQEIIVGVKNFDTMTARWVVIDDFQLEYLGADASGIEAIATAGPGSAAAAVYDLQGRSQQSLRQGINIVRTTDGRVKKILVK